MRSRRASGRMPRLVRGIFLPGVFARCVSGARMSGGPARGVFAWTAWERVVAASAGAAGAGATSAARSRRSGSWRDATRVMCVAPACSRTCPAWRGRRRPFDCRARRRSMPHGRARLRRVRHRGADPVAHRGGEVTERCGGREPVRIRRRSDARRRVSRATRAAGCAADRRRNRAACACAALPRSFRRDIP